MQPSLEKLRKFFRLEAESGYQDRAVIGGLVKMLDFWEGEARSENIPEEVITAVAVRLRDYHDLSSQGRADALKGLWKRIQAQFPAKETAGEAAQSAGEPVPPAAKHERPAPQRRSVRTPSRAESFPGAQTSQTPAALSAALTVLSGIGPRHASTLEKLGLRTLGDMLYYFPRRYDDYSQLKPIHRLSYGEQVTVIGTLQSVTGRPVRGGKMQIVEAVLSDGTGALRLTFFNQPWITNRLKEEMSISVSGRIEQYLGRLVLNNPDWEPLEAENLHTNRIVPVYPLTANITQKWLRGQMKQVVSYWAPRVADPLPEGIRQSAGLDDLRAALLQVHFPDSQERLKAGRARLAFDEIFYLQMGVLRQKRDWQAAAARAFEVDDPWLESRVRVLPYALTGAQQRALDEIRRDLKAGTPMNRLLQGDVGSGKTVVAALAVAMVNRAGSTPGRNAADTTSTAQPGGLVPPERSDTDMTPAAQAAVMAPTSILAEQHYRSFLQVLTKQAATAGRPDEGGAASPADDDYLQPGQVRLLVGDTSAAERKEILEGLAAGDVKVLIGTHALIEEPVQFADLELVVIDEQHRFGVEQRAALRAKGTSPHLLVMTATPIPRSLALTLYGDLDLSVMDEMPAGRQPVSTYVLTPRERERAYSLIRTQIEQGRQAFIVYPLIEESEKSESKAAVEEHGRLQKDVFPRLRLGLLHGRMKPDEKDAVMAQFREGGFDILVSTTVIEVGVDVPNATLMLVEGANHFGLAQLHQLRGRVGRGGGESFCLLVPDHEDAVENERLQAMARSNDGFVLAELDLEQRGPGEFLGTRQSGFAADLKMASLSDVALIEKARNQAQALFEQDPTLQAPEHALLAEAFERFWVGGKGDAS
jgi:ATP-dependent DNA helicase RecG